jgi:hypothetical protein
MKEKFKNSWETMIQTQVWAGLTESVFQPSSDCDFSNRGQTSAN